MIVHHENAAGFCPPELRGRRILVTGASGFLGSHLLGRLRRGIAAEIHGISRKAFSTENGVRWWQGDLADFGTARRILTAIKPEVILHLASHVSGARSIDNVLPTFRSNLMSTVNVLSVTSEIGCKRIVLLNSLEECDGPEPVPSSPYAAAKWASSGYARMFHALFQLPVVILRVSMAYGPAQQDLSKLVPYVTLALLRGEAPKLTSGERQADWIYVDDVVDGILAGSSAADLEGSTIDIGSGELRSVRDVVEELVRVIRPGVEPVFGAVSDRPLEQAHVANAAKAFASMGWKAKTALADGLQSTVRWYREHQAPVL